MLTRMLIISCSNMAKRRNPRAEETPLQWKTHVGFKQMATKEEKERIKAETLKMMLKASGGLSNGSNHQLPNVCSGPSHDTLQLKGITQQKCYLCNAVCSNASAVDKCVCCERCICPSCAQRCNGCGYSCCFLCTTVDYSQSEVRNFCLNCVR